MATTTPQQKPSSGQSIARRVLASTLVAGSIALTLWQFEKPQNPPPAPVLSVVSAVTALGRLEPHGEIVHLSAPTLALESARIARLLVKEGDRVKTGQVIAALDREGRLQATWRQAQQQVHIAQTRLAQVRAGAKRGDLAAQEATIARLEAELRIAQSEYKRYQYLLEKGAISASQLDDKRLIVETTQGQLNQARSTLTSLAEVRPTDVRAAEAEVASAAATVAKAQKDLQTAYVRALQNGQILKIHTRAGEVVGDQAIVDMGQTDQMDVVAEVYEDDLTRVQTGQRATITSLNQAFTPPLRGTIYQIIPVIGKKDILNTDPAADVDARVAEVKIRLDKADRQRVAGLTNLKVQVAIVP
ncbi:ABC exporter membrane fusion protein [Anthocerotibacter panamensis]|uniref:ABC exporter membrane fusion protein n=1 Tax=Anthocerotibacter panamensis TaxID=2857077 RepID=UPI001C402BF8|nr:ABC exporter membrane fusion protein [Anthocerotibacter panamensis]